MYLFEKASFFVIFYSKCDIIFKTKEAGMVFEKSDIEVLHVFDKINETSPKEKQELEKLSEEYWNLDEKFTKSLTKQTDQDFIQTVLAYLYYKLLNPDTGYFSETMVKNMTAQGLVDKKVMGKTLQTIKNAFRTFNFQPAGLSANDLNDKIDSVLKEIVGKKTNKFQKALMKVLGKKHTHDNQIEMIRKNREEELGLVG